MEFSIELQSRIMSFFQEWSLQLICDYYEAEKDLLGSQYCKETEETFDLDEAKANLKSYVQTYPQAFVALLKETTEPHSEMPDPASQIDDFILWVTSDQRRENTRMLVDALLHGFLLEWIVYHYDKKEDFLQVLNGPFPGKNDYDEWEYEYQRLKMTRDSLAREYGITRHASFYLFRRIALLNSLNVIFHAFHNPQKLRLANHIDFIKKSMTRFRISEGVEQFYLSQCKRKGWQKRLSFVAEVDFEQRFTEIISLVAPQSFKFDRDNLTQKIISTYNEMAEFRTLIHSPRKNARMPVMDISIFNIIGILLDFNGNAVNVKELSEELGNALNYNPESIRGHIKNVQEKSTNELVRELRKILLLIINSTSR